MIYSSTNKERSTPKTSILIYGVLMSRTNNKNGHCSHCIICGYEPGRKAKRRSALKILFQVDILPFLSLEGFI